MLRAFRFGDIFCLVCLASGSLTEANKVGAKIPKFNERVESFSYHFPSSIRNGAMRTAHRFRSPFKFTRGSVKQIDIKTDK